MFFFFFKKTCLRPLPVSIETWFCALYLKAYSAIVSHLVCSNAAMLIFVVKLSLDRENAGLGHTRKSALMLHYVMLRDVDEIWADCLTFHRGLLLCSENVWKKTGEHKGLYGRNKHQVCTCSEVTGLCKKEWFYSLVLLREDKQDSSCKQKKQS